MKEAVIVSACRTPIGSFNGSLKDIPVIELGRIVMEEVIRRGHIKADLVDEVLCGCVLQAAQGQNVARQAMLKAGLPFKIPAMTINKVCGSGLRVVSLAAQIIKSGDADCVIACGMESMSNAPYALAKARNGYRMGDGVLIDTMVNDGLCEVSENYHMGITAENINEQWKITREEQDEFALKSQQRAAAAISQGKFKDEIVPVIIKGKKSDIVFDTDEFPRATTIEAISKMKPAFKKEGLVTAANSSGINDGASAVLVMSREKSDELGIKPMARILSYANSGVEPRIMGIGPVSSTQVALAKAGLKVSDLDLIEANEAFAAQSIAVAKDMGWIDMEKVNVNGGAIALGHPIGASGNRILVSLLHEMQKQGSRYGLATLCIGGGMGTSLIVENFV